MGAGLTTSFEEEHEKVLYLRNIQPFNPECCCPVEFHFLEAAFRPQASDPFRRFICQSQITHLMLGTQTERAPASALRDKWTELSALCPASAAAARREHRGKGAVQTPSRGCSCLNDKMQTLASTALERAAHNSSGKPHGGVESQSLGQMAHQDLAC